MVCGFWVVGLVDGWGCLRDFSFFLLEQRACVDSEGMVSYELVEVLRR